MSRRTVTTNNGAAVNSRVDAKAQTVPNLSQMFSRMNMNVGMFASSSGAGGEKLYTDKEIQSLLDQSDSSSPPSPSQLFDAGPNSPNDSYDFKLSRTASPVHQPGPPEPPGAGGEKVYTLEEIEGFLLSSDNSKPQSPIYDAGPPEPPPMAPANDPKMTLLHELLRANRQTAAQMRELEPQLQQALTAYALLKGRYDQLTTAIMQLYKSMQAQEQAQAQAQAQPGLSPAQIEIRNKILLQLLHYTANSDIPPVDRGVVQELLKEFALYSEEVEKWRGLSQDTQAILSRIKSQMDDISVLFFNIQNPEDLPVAMKEIQDKLVSILKPHPYATGTARMDNSKSMEVPEMIKKKKQKPTTKTTTETTKWSWL